MRRVMLTNINGNRDELAIAASKFDVVACAETKVTGRRHLSELLLLGFKAPTLLLRGAHPNGLGMALFVRSGLSVSRRERLKCRINQSVDRKSVFCFVGDFNCHYSKWLGSRITDAHGVAAFDFATVADCS